MTVTALALAEPPEDDSYGGHLSLVHTIGTDGDDWELADLLLRAQSVLAEGNRLMADLAGMIQSHQVRRNHLREVTAECRKEIIDTGEHVMAEFEKRLAEVRTDDE